MYIDVDVLVGATKMFISISDKLALIKTAKLNKPKVRPYTHIYTHTCMYSHTNNYTLTHIRSQAYIPIHTH